VEGTGTVVVVVGGGGTARAKGQKGKKRNSLALPPVPHGRN